MSSHADLALSNILFLIDLGQDPQDQVDAGANAVSFLTEASGWSLWVIDVKLCLQVLCEDSYYEICTGDPSG